MLSRIGHKETGETPYGCERLARKKLVGLRTAMKQTHGTCYCSQGLVRKRLVVLLTIKDWSQRNW
jgi:hypothetical protein